MQYDIPQTYFSSLFWCMSVNPSFGETFVPTPEANSLYFLTKGVAREGSDLAVVGLHHTSHEHRVTIAYSFSDQFAMNGPRRILHGKWK